MTEVIKKNNIANECDNHNSIWFPIHTYIDTNTNNHMIDCICLKCKMIKAFTKNEIMNKMNYISIEYGMILPLSIAISDYNSLKEDNNSDEIICKTMRKRYSNKY